MHKKKITSLVLAFFMFFFFVPVNFAAADAIDDIVIQMQEIYEFMSETDRNNISDARTQLQNFAVNGSEDDWDTVLGVDTGNNLLTGEVITRFGDEATARAAAKDIFTGLGNIYYSTDPTGLGTILEDFKAEYIDEFQLLFGSDITMDDFYGLIFDAREALPFVIDDTDAALLATGSNGDLIDAMPLYLNEAMDAALLQNSKFSGRLAAIDWSTSKLIAQQKELAGIIDTSDSAQLSLALAAVRSETELASGPITLQVGDIPEYSVHIMGRNATSLVAWASADPTIVEVSTDSQTGNFVIKAIAPGTTELIVYRDYTGGNPANDWLLKFDVTVEGDDNTTVKGYASWYNLTDNAGITVTAKSGDTISGTTTTDADGLFELALPDSTYNLELTVPGYLKTIIQNVTVAGNLVEVSTQVAPIAMSAGDINASGLVDLTDLVLLADAYGTITEQAKYLLAADFNRSGLIDLTDLVHLADHYGEQVTVINN